MTTATRIDPIEAPLARSAVYAFLAHALAYPTAERLERMRNDLGPVLAELPEDVVPAHMVNVVLQHLAMPADMLQRDFGRVFTHTVSPDCPTYETAYSARDIFQQAQAMADVAGFYRAHGLKVGGPERERADHIATELEFMGFVALKHAYALENLGDEEVELCRETEQLFLRDHLGRWGGALGQRTSLTAQDQPFYAAVGDLLAEWIDRECERVGTGPLPRLDEPVLSYDEMDDASCDGPGDGGVLISFDDIPTQGV